MARYASNQDVVRFFASHGIEVSHVRREGPVRHLQAAHKAITLPMDASPEECLRIVRDAVAGAAMQLPVTHVCAKSEEP
ncbi:hypothetical protein [Prosthecobacter sp.]|uniref:hypothetical protein n=1 Tax=Prosthecobacter sp. TaxID=1965333 RepID=UPI003783EB0B